MAVLVGAGVLCFPWLFETQPRPMSPDIRIVQASGQGGDADVGARAVSGRVASITPPPVAPVRVPVATTEAVAQTPADRPADKALEKPPAQAAKPVKPVERADKTERKAADKVATRPETKAEAKPAAKAEDKAGTRYVVQFGAFADANSARETRQKAERLGLKTYAQQVDTPAGKRIRVRLGPFADRAEAEKALTTLRKGGLSGAILTL